MGGARGGLVLSSGHPGRLREWPGAMGKRFVAAGARVLTAGSTTATVDRPGFDPGIPSLVPTRQCGLCAAPSRADGRISGRPPDGKGPNRIRRARLPRRIRRCHSGMGKWLRPTFCSAALHSRRRSWRSFRSRPCLPIFLPVGFGVHRCNHGPLRSPVRCSHEGSRTSARDRASMIPDARERGPGMPGNEDFPFSGRRRKAGLSIVGKEGRGARGKLSIINS
jgi:hypothetical protein